jgi:hypothetical protein
LRSAEIENINAKVLTSSFLLYMPVFAALAGGNVAHYHPLQAPAGFKVAPAGGKVALAGGKVINHPLWLLYRPLEQKNWCC